MAHASIQRIYTDDTGTVDSPLVNYNGSLNFPWDGVVPAGTVRKLIAATFRPSALQSYLLKSDQTITVEPVHVPTLNPPAAPSLSTASTGGTVHDGTYQVIVSYTNANGETIGSNSASQVTSGGNLSTLTITSPPSVSGATGWYAYVTQVGGSTFTRQQAAGSPTAIGTNLTLSAPPTSIGAPPQLVNTSGGFASAITVTGGKSIMYPLTPLDFGGDAVAGLGLNNSGGTDANVNLRFLQS